MLATWMSWARLRGLQLVRVIVEAICHGICGKKMWRRDSGWIGHEKELNRRDQRIRSQRVAVTQRVSLPHVRRVTYDRDTQHTKHSVRALLTLKQVLFDIVYIIADTGYADTTGQVRTKSAEPQRKSVLTSLRYRFYADVQL